MAASNCRDPVAVFSKRTNVELAGPELRSALASGNPQQVRVAAEREWTRRSAYTSVFLDITVYERATIEARDIVMVDDFTFGLPAPLRRVLESATLFHEHGFVLRDAEGQVVDMPFGPPATPPH